MNSSEGGVLWLRSSYGRTVIVEEKWRSGPHANMHYNL